MLQRLATRIKSSLKILIFGLQVLRWCGPWYFLKKFIHQIYGCTIYIVEEHPLNMPYEGSSFQCNVSLATQGDVDELFSAIPSQSREGRYQLLVRKFYHEKGFGDCYIARTTDTDEICHVRWLVTPKHIRNLGWEESIPLAEDQIMRENSYTIEKFRRKGVRTSFVPKITEIALNLGYKRVKGLVDETNIIQLKLDQRDGDLVYARIMERHILFHISRKTLERYDPPIPITIPEEE